MPWEPRAPGAHNTQQTCAQDSGLQTCLPVGVSVSYLPGPLVYTHHSLFL